MAATAVVNFAPNVSKVGAVGGMAEKSLVLRFGLPAMAAALVGAMTLGHAAWFKPIRSYIIGPLTASITPSNS